MCEVFEVTGSISSMVTALVAIAALIFAIFAYRLSKRTFRYQIINEMFKEYRSKEMGQSIRKLHDYYRKAGEERTKLISNYKKDYQDEMDSPDSIHNHRRAVSNFYQQAAILADKDKYIKKNLYYIWKRDDLLKIIGSIIVPIETVALRELLGDKAIEKPSEYPKYIKLLLKLCQQAPVE